MSIDLQNLPGTGLKNCKGCKILKSVDCFTKHPNTKDKLRPKCRACRKAEYLRSKKECTVPGCNKKIDNRAKRCTSHANIKSANKEVRDESLDSVILKSKTKEYFVKNAQRYRDAGKTKKKCPVPNCNEMIEKTSNMCSKHAAINFHHKKLSAIELSVFSSAYINDYRLKKWSKIVRKRDDYTCRKCGYSSDKMKVHAHHIMPKSIYKNLIFDADNGMTLCEKCHISEHQKNEGRDVNR